MPQGDKKEEEEVEDDDDDDDDDNDDELAHGNIDSCFPWKQLTRSGKCRVIQLANCFQRDLSEAGGGH